MYRSFIVNILALSTPHQPIDVDAEPKEALVAKNPNTLSVLVGPEAQILADFATIAPSKRLAIAVNKHGTALAVIANTNAFAFEVPVFQVQQIVDLNKGDFTFFHQISVVGEANVALIDGDNKAPYVMAFARQVREVLVQKGETSAMFIGSTDKRTVQAWLNGSEENVEIVGPFEGELRHKIEVSGLIVAKNGTGQYAVLPAKQLVAYLETEIKDRAMIGYSMDQLEGVQIEDMSLDTNDNGQFFITTTDGNYLLATITLEGEGLTGKIVVQSTINVDETSAILRADDTVVITLDRGANGTFAVRPTSNLAHELQEALAA